jgi:hypothetical protein
MIQLLRLFTLFIVIIGVHSCNKTIHSSALDFNIESDPVQLLSFDSNYSNSKKLENEINEMGISLDAREGYGYVNFRIVDYSSAGIELKGTQPIFVNVSYDFDLEYNITNTYLELEFPFYPLKREAIKINLEGKNQNTVFLIKQYRDEPKIFQTVKSKLILNKPVIDKEQYFGKLYFEYLNEQNTPIVIEGEFKFIPSI